MAVVYVKEKYRRSGRHTKDGAREYTKTFIVKTNSTGDGPLTIMRDPRLPQRWRTIYATGNEIDLGAICTDVNPKQIDDDGQGNSIWEVPCQFAKATKESQEEEENPLLRPAEVSWDGATYQDRLEYDLDGHAILNAAGDPYEEGLVVDRTRQILSITRNELRYDYELAQSYADVLNSDTFYGRAAGSAKMTMPKSSRKVEGKWIYWQTRYEIHFSRLGWSFLKLNQGPHYLDEDGVKKPNTMDGVATTKPVLLAADGTKLADEADPIFNTFVGYPSLAFAPLALE